MLRTLGIYSLNNFQFYLTAELALVIMLDITFPVIITRSLYIFKCKSQWHKVHSQCCVTVTMLHLQNLYYLLLRFCIYLD